MSFECKPRVRVVNTSGIGHETKIYIDDVDVSGCFNNVTVNAALDGGVEVQLSAVVCEVEVDRALVLRWPGEDTRELLVKHGWSPPVEPVVVPAPDKQIIPYEPIDHDLLEPGESLSGEELIERLFGRIKDKWSPNLDDTLTVTRTRRRDGTLIPGRRTYTLRVTMDGVHPDPDPDAEPSSLVAAANDAYHQRWWANMARDRDGNLWRRANGGKWWRPEDSRGRGIDSITWDQLTEQFGPMEGPFVSDEDVRDDC